MPNHEEHCTESLKRYGKSFSELHSWMDEPSTILGAKHRKYRHDPNVTPEEAKAIFGEGADNACLDHIRFDELESRKSITDFWSPKTNHYETKNVLPVMNFTIQSPAGVWHFQSEPGCISKDGKKCFCFRSSSLSQESIRKQKEEDEDDELRNEPDNPEGEA